MKIAICIPSMDRVHATFMMAYVGMVERTLASKDPPTLYHFNMQCSVIHHARNWLVVMAQERAADWLLWLDSDLDFPRDALLHLLKYDLDIVGATYSRRAPPYEANGIFVGPPCDLSAGGLHEAVGLPGGLMLVRAAVYEKVPSPWYEDRYAPNTTTLERMSEDYDFCLKASQAGFKIWCDISLSTKVSHLAEVPLTLNSNPGAAAIRRSAPTGWTGIDHV